MATQSPIDVVGSSAFNVAYWRSEEAHRPNPLFIDTHAPHFETRDRKDHAARVERILPEAKTMVRYRTRYIDDLLAAQTSAGVDQVLLLGAGLDTRSLRCSAPGVRFFEVDRAGPLDFKQHALAKAGIAYDCIAVACDYVAEDLNARIRSTDFDPELLTLVIWEGNSYYLPPAAALQTLKRLRELLPRFILALDYVSDGLAQRSTGMARLDSFADALVQLEVPWTTGFANARPIADVLGAEVVDDLTIAEFITRLGREEPDRDEAVLGHFSLAVLQKT